MTSTKTRALTAALLASTLLAACNAGASTTGSSGSTTPGGTTPGSGTGPADAGSTSGAASTGGAGGAGSTAAPRTSDETVRVGLVAEPASLDFTTTDGAAIPQVMLDNVYETLVRVDPQNGQIVPSLASSWEVDARRTTYTFTLKDGVTFSNGAEFTAQDAKFSLDRVSSDAWTTSLKAQLDVVKQVQAKDDHTLVVTLKQPSNAFLYALTTRVGAMFDTEGVADLATKPVGTGPYVFQKWDRGSRITLQRNEKYHGDEPYFRTVEMDYFKDANALNNAMLTDAIDIVSTVQAPETLAEFDPATYQVVEGTTNGEVVLSMNNQKGPFTDKRLRQAVRYAIDHRSLVDTCWAGKGELIGSMVPPTDPWYEDRTGDYPFDAAKAKSLVEEAGKGKKVKVRLRIPTLPYAVSCGTVVESMLEDAGFDVTIDELEFPSAWLEQVFTAKDYDLSIVAHVEPRDLGSVFGNPKYYTGYGTPAIQALLKAADQGSEDEQVVKMKEAAKLISDDAAADVLFLLPNLVVADQDITGLPKNAVTESFDLADLARG